jgi:HAD superfamily hydrolase (TIGR01549 family)
MKKNKTLKKKLIIFDLDGVIVNSLVNMRISWNYISKKYYLNVRFNDYKKYIGLPFKKILKNLNILNNPNILFNDYNKISKQNLNKIKFYKNIKLILKNLKSKYYLAIFTSKNKERTHTILRKLNVKFDAIVTPEDILKGKPNPEGLIKIMKIVNVKQKNTLFIGDTIYDEIAAKRAKIKFVFALWGYGKNSNRLTKKINNITEIKNYI